MALYIAGMRMKSAWRQPQGAKIRKQVNEAWLKCPTQLLIQGQWWSIFITHLHTHTHTRNSYNAYSTIHTLQGKYSAKKIIML